MGVHSGKFGLVNNQSTLDQWSINDNMTPALAYTSNSQNGPIRSKGVSEWNGSFSQQLATPGVLAGADFSFQGYTAPVDDVLGSDGQLYAGQALCSQNVINWEWGTSSYINAVSTFLGKLALGITSGAPPTDTTDPGVATPCGTKVEYSADGVAWNDLLDLVTGSLTLSVATEDVVNSTTNCQTDRRAGPKDWTMAFTQQNDDGVAGPQRGEILQWRMYTTATDFYLVKFGIVRDFTGLAVNRDGTIIQRTINIDGTMFDGTNYGEVVLPDGTTKWYEAIDPTP